MVPWYSLALFLQQNSTSPVHLFFWKEVACKCPPKLSGLFCFILNATSAKTFWLLAVRELFCKRLCLRGLPTLPLQPTLVRMYLADRQAPPTRHYPPVRSRGAQPVSHATCLCSFMPWGFKAIKNCVLNLENTGWGTDLCPFGAKPEGGGGCSVKGLGRGVSLGPSTLITARSPSLTAGHHGNGWYVIPTTMPNLPPASLTIFPNQHTKFSLSLVCSVLFCPLAVVLYYIIVDQGQCECVFDRS